MASRPRGPVYSPDEVLNEIFADPDSDLDENSIEEEYEGESYQEYSSGEDNIEGIESDVSDTGTDNNQLQQQPRGIDHDPYMVFTGAVIIVFSSNSNFINNPIWPPVGWHNMVWQGRG